MTDQTQESLGTGLVLQDRVPLRWRPAQAHEDDPVRLQLANEEALRVILSLDAHHVEGGDENPELAHEIERLESKINLLLELVGQVLASQLKIPDAVPVRLSAREIAWQSPEPTPTAGDGIVEVYVCTRYPRPLLLPVRFRPARLQSWTHADLGELGEPVQELMEKLIFRHHRRQIAASRRNS
jgi:Atypical PilZ domain, cyclic di-GMP receptor